jgi:hypothetical protein
MSARGVTPGPFFVDHYNTTKPAMLVGTFVDDPKIFPSYPASRLMRVCSFR